MAASRDRSARRLVSLHHGPRVTQAGLAKILDEVRKHGLPSASSASTQRRARHKVCEHSGTPYGPVLEAVDFDRDGNDPFHAYVMAPLPLLWRLAHDSCAFRDLLLATAKRSPPTPQTPWSIALYWDEITPQNPLAAGKDKRKTQNIYWTFLEFTELYKADRWMVLAVGRSAEINSCAGGMSNFLSVVAEFFFRRSGVNISTAGLSFCFLDEPLVIFAAHRVTVTDFAALNEVIGNRFGTLPCPLCRDVVDHKSSAANHPGLHSLTSTDAAAWTRHTNNSVRVLVTRLRANAEWMSATEFKEYQQEVGYTFNPRSILYNEHLRYSAVTSMMFDWAHIFCVDGICAREIKALMAAIRDGTPRGKASVVSYDSMHSYMKQWYWPQQFRDAKNVFETGAFQANASSTLGCLPVLRRFFRDVVRDVARWLDDNIASFLLMCDVVDILREPLGAESAGRLRDATKTWLDKHLEAYGSRYWVLKHHQALHLPDMLAAFGCLLSTFTMERKHKDTKRICSDHLNTRGYEKSIMEEHFVCCLHAWSKDGQALGLVGGRDAPKTIRESLQAHAPHAGSIRVGREYVAEDGARFFANDVVQLSANGAVGEVWFHCAFDDEDTQTCVSLWERRWRSNGIAQYVVCRNPRLIPSRLLREALIYKINGGVCTALVSDG